MFEYPKWVYRTDGPQESYPAGMAPVLVQSREEEDALMAGDAQDADAADDIDAPAARRTSKSAK